jgi:outer membrane protein OmpA-like peptidoglycan-associated protein
MNKNGKMPQAKRAGCASCESGGPMRKARLTVLLVLAVATWASAQSAPTRAVVADSQARPVLEPGKPPIWWFGLAAGANLNFYGGTTQELNPAFTAPAAFHKGFGAGLYLAPVLEYRPHPVWGGILQLGYDDRRGDFDDVPCPCGEMADLSAKPAYLSLEPSLRVAPFAEANGRAAAVARPLYLFAGPRFAFLAPWGDPDAFHYTQEGAPSVNGSFSRMRDVVFSGQIGLGYDFDWKKPDSRTQIQLAPFVSYQPHFGQDPRDGSGLVDRWAVSTLRIGAVLKFGKSRPATADVRFSVWAPPTVVTRHKILETFPLRNYVFFDDDAMQFADRYVRLSRPQAEAFREENLLQDGTPSRSGRAARQIAVNHQLLNILGSRMRRLSGTTITLVGLSAQGAEHGRARAESVRLYLVEAFGIAPSRIETQGRTPPPIESGDATDRAMLQAENQRVEIVSRSPELLVQIGEGAQYMLKPIQMEDEAAGTDSVLFSAPGAAVLASWNLEITDDSGKMRRFGPYTGERQAIPATLLLGERARGAYEVVLTGKTPGGTPLRRKGAFSLSRRHEGIQRTMRYAILFDLDQAQAVSAYERFLNQVVAARIPDSSTVFIRGRTDAIGEADHNLKLARERAEGVARSLEASSSRNRRREVVLVPTWSGEDPKQAPFGNTTPEERCYNRTVIIDIVPE